MVWFVAVPGSLLILGLGLAWWQARRIRRFLHRWGARLGAVVAAWAVSWAWLALADRSLESGTWFCWVCARCEERLVWRRVPLSSTTSPDEEYDSRVARLYRDWFEQRVVLEHEHDWVPTGCHSRGFGTIACSFPWGRRAFYVTLPRVPAPDVARELAVRLATAEPAERTELLADFDREEGDDLFRRIELGASLSPAEFGASYGDWLERHPLWR